MKKMEPTTRFTYFDPRDRPKIANGEKTSVIRSRKLGDPGDILAFQDSYLRIISVEHLPYIEALNHWASEGYCSRAEMRHRFKQRFHGAEPVADRGFYIHHFERITQ
jgi:hypothetical protein